MIATLKKKLTLENLSLFFMGDVYPLVVCFIVLLGNITGLEYYLNFLNTALMVTALLVSKSVRPFIISLCTYVYQISLKNSPNYPNYSDFYYTGWRLPVSIAIIAVVAAAIIFFFVKNRIYAKISFKNTPLLLPLLILSAAFMANGIFSSEWVASNLLFGIANVAVYFFLFVMIYHGFSEEEDSRELSRYFAYVTMLIAFLISFELINLFLTADNIFVDGAIVKTSVALGWGIWNLVAVSLAILIPVLFYGVQNNKYPWLYFTAATLAFVMSVLTMSRNALIFSTLAYAVCVIISCFFGKYKKAFRIITLVGIVCVILFAIVLWDKIQALLADYFERGLSDNGRFNLWRLAYDNFLSAPVFGAGFYGFDVETAVFGPLPKQAHNTVLQLLSATGVVGLASYLFYRVKTIKPFVKRPTLMKSFLGISILVLLAESMLDNFIFNIYPMFYYAVALSIVFRAAKEEQRV